MPDFIRSLENNSKLIVRNPNHIRPWQFVMEPLYGYILLAERIYKKQINIKQYCWNFAPDEENCIEVKKVHQTFLQKFK